MLAGHLQEKKGIYYIVLNCKDEYGKRKPKWISTGLKVKGNKKKAEALLQKARKEYTAKQQELEQAAALLKASSAPIPPFIIMRTLAKLCNMPLKQN